MNNASDVAPLNNARANLPDFLIIGASKSGTTSLYRYLDSHPEIYMSSIKEPRYFAFAEHRPQVRGPYSERLNRRIVWKLEDYRKLFSRQSQEKVAGEASAMYLNSLRSPKTIQRMIPDVRLIAILRHPADRAYSSFCQNRRNGAERFHDFSLALEAEEERSNLHWVGFNYRNAGSYGSHLERYYSLFPKKQLLVFLYEDLVADVSAVLGNICRFLDVDDEFQFDTSEQHNVTRGIPRSNVFSRMLKEKSLAKSAFKLVASRRSRRSLRDKLSSLNLAAKPPYPPEVRQRLCDFYREDILKLQKMIDRDLSTWLKN